MAARFGTPAKRFWFLGAVVLLLVIAGCAHQPSAKLAVLVSNPPGFFSGFLHGFLIIFSFIGSLFTDVRIYSFPNSGGWYDFGFLLGAASFLGGGGASARQRPNPPLNSDPACIVFRSLSTFGYPGFVQRLGAGGSG